LKATAETKDGLIEAIEDVRTDRWVNGVQWHPEIEWEADQFSSDLFKAFIEAAHIYADTYSEQHVH
jgi:gamma-glutamyl-gamma-aminobutyrate hydrolase PuuD